MKTIIISGGHVEDAFALKWIKENTYDLRVAVDAGLDFFCRNKLSPNLILGDFDSVNEKSKQFLKKDTQIETIRLKPEKDDTDTEFAIHEAIRRGATDITIIGASGTRLDHVLGNMYLLGIGCEKGINIQLVDAHNCIRLINKKLTLHKDTQFGEFVSILPIAGDAKGVSLKGFKYPLKDAQLESFRSLGISNEIVEDTATITVKKGYLLVVESRD